LIFILSLNLEQFIRSKRWLLKKTNKPICLLRNSLIINLNDPKPGSLAGIKDNVAQQIATISSNADPEDNRELMIRVIQVDHNRRTIQSLLRVPADYQLLLRLGRKKVVPYGLYSESSRLWL
jgi:hypothetical protein